MYQTGTNKRPQVLCFVKKRLHAHHLGCRKQRVFPIYRACNVADTAPVLRLVRGYGAAAVIHFAALYLYEFRMEAIILIGDSGHLLLLRDPRSR